MILFAPNNITKINKSAINTPIIKTNSKTRGEHRQEAQPQNIVACTQYTIYSVVGHAHYPTQSAYIIPALNQEVSPPHSKPRSARQTKNTFLSSFIVLPPQKARLAPRIYWREKKLKPPEAKCAIDTLHAIGSTDRPGLVQALMAPSYF